MNYQFSGAWPYRGTIIMPLVSYNLIVRNIIGRFPFLIGHFSVLSGQTLSQRKPTPTTTTSRCLPLKRRLAVKLVRCFWGGWCSRVYSLLQLRRIYQLANLWFLKCLNSRESKKLQFKNSLQKAATLHNEYWGISDSLLFLWQGHILPGLLLL